MYSPIKKPHVICHVTNQKRRTWEECIFPQKEQIVIDHLTDFLQQTYTVTCNIIRLVHIFMEMHRFLSKICIGFLLILKITSFKCFTIRDDYYYYYYYYAPLQINKIEQTLDSDSGDDNWCLMYMNNSLSNKECSEESCSEIWINEIMFLRFE